MDIPPPSDEKGEALIVVIGTERALPPLRCSALPVCACSEREGRIDHRRLPRALLRLSVCAISFLFSSPFVCVCE